MLVVGPSHIYEAHRTQNISFLNRELSRYYLDEDFLHQSLDEVARLRGDLKEEEDTSKEGYRGEKLGLIQCQSFLLDAQSR